MSNVSRVVVWAAAVVVGVAGLGLGGCGQSEGVPIEFAAEYDKPLAEGEKRVLTVTSLTGPGGATPEDVKAGTYVVKGTYDLTGSKFDHGAIDLSIEGSFDMITKAGASPDAPLHELLGTHIEIPKGQLTGPFEVRFGIKKVKSDKTGEIRVAFFGNQKISDENTSRTVHETVVLRGKK